MKLFAPSYYQKFKCIADRCQNSCCIGWEIDVDEGTYGRYAKSEAPYAKNILRSIEAGEEGTKHFRLASGERCPHLDARGLCRIISQMGEAYLCEICREHPRFYHDTKSGKEVGLGMACEEACRLILTEDYRTFVPIGECEGEPYRGAFDATKERAALYAILSDRALLYPERLRAISEAYGVSLAIHADEEWRAILQSLEYLNPPNKDRFARFSSAFTHLQRAEGALERALAYFVFRHASAAESLDEFRARLGFCLFCERLLASLVSEAPEEDVAALARVLSEELEYSEENTVALIEEFYFSLP
ncbi:MAG: flagellin lysine-N-methylase [Clostridia bacterium]|nr:flagellin lysine-N-methylase [Clostridia bacterium]